MADPNCVFIAASTTDPDLSTASAGTVALIYNPDPDVSTQIQPAFDVVVYDPPDNLYGIAFHLCYDSSILALVGTASLASVGNPAVNVIDFKGLGADGVGTALQVEAVGEGTAAKIIFGLTRLDPTVTTQSFDAGWNIVARFFFTGSEEGTVDFSFNKLFLVGSDGADIAGVKGLSGSAITAREECL